MFNVENLRLAGWWRRTPDGPRDGVGAQVHEQHVASQSPILRRNIDFLLGFLLFDEEFNIFNNI